MLPTQRTKLTPYQDLTRLESGHETSFNEPFNLKQAIDDATMLYRNEASRRGLSFELDLTQCPRIVIGDARKIRTVVANLTANAGMSCDHKNETVFFLLVLPVKYTFSGAVKVKCFAYEEPAGLRDSSGDIAVEIVVEDTGCGIGTEKLESIFREFEQVENAQTPPPQSPTTPQSNGLGACTPTVIDTCTHYIDRARVGGRRSYY